jgi:hypothetical protein
MLEMIVNAGVRYHKSEELAREKWATGRFA